MKKKVAAVLLGSAALVGAFLVGRSGLTESHDVSVDGMLLATQLMNRDGESRMDFGDRRHQYMVSALQTALVSAGRKASEITPLKAAEYFTELRVELFAGPNDEANGMAIRETLSDVERLIAGCPQRQSSAGDEGLLTARFEASCGHPAIPMIRELGFEELTASQRNLVGGQRLRVSLQRPQMTDMRYDLRMVRQIATLGDSLRLRLDLVSLDRPIGRSSGLRVLYAFDGPVPGNAKMGEPFAIEIFNGANDCLAGCIDREFTVVDVQPEAKPNGGWKFEARIRSRSGFPAPVSFAQGSGQ